MTSTQDLPVDTAFTTRDVVTTPLIPDEFWPMKTPDGNLIVNIVNGYSHGPTDDPPTIAEAWRDRLANLSITIHDQPSDNVAVDTTPTAAASQKKKAKIVRNLGYRRRRRIAKCRKHIAQLTVSIDALNQYSIDWCKKFSNGEVSREVLIGHLNLIDATIDFDTRRRGALSLEIDRINQLEANGE